MVTHITYILFANLNLSNLKPNLISLQQLFEGLSPSDRKDMGSDQGLQTYPNPFPIDGMRLIVIVNQIKCLMIFGQSRALKQRNYLDLRDEVAVILTKS